MADDKGKELLHKYSAWYRNEYGKIVGLDKLVEKIKIINPKLEPFVKNFAYTFSSVWRHEKFTVMKYYAAPKKVNYICTVFKISRKSTTAIYAFLYSSLENGKIQHEYMAVSPTLASADGEYRHGFVPVSQYIKVYNEAKEVFDLVEDYFIKQVDKGDVVLFTDTVGAFENDNDKTKIVNSINEHRLPIIFYVAGWCIDYLRFANGQFENHITPNYPIAMFSQTDAIFYKKNKEILKKYEGIILFAFRRLETVESQKFLPTSIGQKIIPLTVTQLENIDSIKYPTWSELLINSYASDLVMNGICPSFPLFNNWFLIQNTGQEIYDNKIMHSKIHNSEITSDVIRQLESARKNTYIYDSIKKEEFYHSYNMKKLSDLIENPVNYAEEEIIISKNSLCILNEYVGRTLADQLTLENVPDIIKIYGKFLDNKIMLDMFIFEYFYALYALHMRLGVIHGDLHLNNATLMSKRGVRDVDKHATIIFNVHEILYSFRTIGRDAYIIDFSRAILARDSTLLSNINEHDKNFVLTSHKQKILKTYEREFPEFFNAYKVELEQALSERYDLVFPLFSAVDIYKLSSGLLMIVREPSSLKKIEEIKKMATQYLTIGMIKIFKKQITNPKEIVWPALDIINRQFQEYIITPESPIAKNPEEYILVDYFNIDNEMKYNTRNYDDFPPTAKFDKAVEMKLPFNELGFKNFKKYFKDKKYVKKEEKDLEKLQQQENEEKMERRGLKDREKTATSVNVGIKDKKNKSMTTSSFYYDT